MTTDDMDLVREFARTGSEGAFAALVAQHIDLVYSVALRQVRDPHLSEEITQTVFIILARRAGTLGPKAILPGWLYRTTRFTCAKALTTVVRRQRREQEAYMRAQLDQTEAEAWSEIEPLLESAMGQLGGKDHDALVMRFFKDQTFKEISSALGTTEAGAKMRVNRALEKLRRLFAKRGLTVSCVLIAGAISGHSVQAAPAGLAGSVVVVAAKGASVATPVLTLLEQTLKYMAWTKMKTAAVIGAVALLAAGTATLTIHYSRATTRSSEVRFAGYATPEASLQSVMWAASRGDFQGVLAACTPEQAQRLEGKMAGKSDDEIRRQSQSWAAALRGYRITQKEVVSDNEVYLHIRATPSPEGLRDGTVTVVLQKIGNEWKQDRER